MARTATTCSHALPASLVCMPTCHGNSDASAREDGQVPADAVDEAYLAAWWEGVREHQDVKMSWDEFKKHGVYKFQLHEPHVAFREQIRDGEPFETPSGKIEIFSTTLGQIEDWTKTQYGYPIPAIPKWIEPFEFLNSPKVKDYPYHLVSPHRAGVPIPFSTTSHGCVRLSSRS